MTALERVAEPTYAAPKFASDVHTYNSAQVCQLTGATYRMLDHWIRKGYLPKDADGSGSVRMYGPAELDLVYLVVRLIDAGFTLEAAFPIARTLIAQDTYSCVIADIFEMTIAVRDTSSEVAKPETPPTEEPA